MSNAPLRVGCPVCSGTGQVSWLRSGAWINEHCPGRNGPVDVDSSPFTHELDNYRDKRKARIEYKRPDEPIKEGQLKHFKAELRSVKDDWYSSVIVVVDEGQQRPDDPITYFALHRNDLRWGDAQVETVGVLGKKIAELVWPA